MDNITIWRDFPALSALRAFSAFAGAETLDQAGASIGVTHAAISQQIRALESHLGVRLVARDGRRLTLTTEGRQLAAALDESFGRIAQCLADLRRTDGARPLRVTTTPAFAGGWLLPRLPDFRARNPGVDLVIDASAELRRLGEDADVAIRFGNGDWPGTKARLLLRTPVVVVASPRLVPPGGLGGLERLAHLPWLQELGTNEATAFLHSLGLSRQGGAGFVSLPGNMMLDAARDGQGIAVTARAFVEADLAAGRLILLHEDSDREGYFLATAVGPQRSAAQAFVDWAARQTGGN